MAETTSEDSGPISLTAYARHLGVSVVSISKGIKRGRISAAAVVYVGGQPKIRDVRQADSDWVMNVRRPRLTRPPFPPGKIRVRDTDLLSVFTEKDMGVSSTGIIVLSCSEPDADTFEWICPLTAAGARVVAEGLLAAASRVDGRRNG